MPNNEVTIPGGEVQVYGPDPVGDGSETALATITAFRSSLDGAMVIQIDTHASDTERLRVDINDGTVYDAIPNRGDHHDTVTTYAEELMEKVLKPRSWQTQEATQ
jgi:hypothetical protein